MRLPLLALASVVLFSCAREQSEPAAPLPFFASPAKAPLSSSAAELDAAAADSAVEGSVDEALAAPSAPDATAPLDAAAPAPSVDRSRCPLFPPGHGASSWRPVREVVGLAESELAACCGSAVDATGDRRLFFFPRGCSYERTELELRLRGGRVASARVRSHITGQHCQPID